MHSLPRRVRRFFSAGTDPAARAAGARLALRAHTRRFVAAQTLIHGFYAFMLYMVVSQLDEAGGLADRTALLPLWPVYWLGDLTTHFALAVRALFVFYAAGSFLAAVLPGSRAARIVACLGLLEYLALKNSHGKIGHSMHLLMLVSILLIFLPDGWHRPAPRTSRAVRQGTLFWFWTCQAAVLLTYTMSGVGKLGGALYQMAHLAPNAFTPGAFGAHIAQRLLQTHSESLLGAWIIEHPGLTWFAMPAAVYIEFFSFWIAFRPALARPWAAALILFHLGTFFTMTITFPQSCFLLALFFFRSPFAPENTPRWPDLLCSVPLASGMMKLVQSIRPRCSEEGIAVHSDDRPA